MKTKKLHYGYIIVACCCMMMGIDVGLAMSCAGIFYQPVSEAIGATTGEFGLYMSLSFLTSALSLGFAGRMIEKYSARKLLSVSSAVLGLTMILMSKFTCIWEFYAAGCVIGVTLAFLLYLSFPTLINRWFRKNVGFLIGLCSAASGIGGILFNPVGGWIITQWGWHAGYIAFGGVISLVVTPAIWYLLRDYPSDKGLLPVGATESGASSDRCGHPAGSAAPQGVDYSRAVRTPAFYVLILFAFLIMASSTLFLFLPKYASSVGFSIEQGALVASGAMAGVTVGKLALGYINDRNCTVGVLVSTLSGIAGLLVMLCWHRWLAAIIGGAFLFGWCYAAVTVQTAVLVREVFGSREYARIYSMVSIALAAGGTVASGAWGFIVDRTSFAFIFGMGCVMLAVCLISGLWSLRSRAMS